MKQQQGSYLLRPEKEKESNFLSWLSCCTGYQNIPFKHEVVIERPVLTLRKPTKQRLTKTGFNILHSSKENTVKGERAHKTDRKQEVYEEIKCLRFSQYQSPRNMQNRVSSNSYQPNSQIRFSYGNPADSLSSRQKENVVSDYLGNHLKINAKKAEHIIIQDQIQESKHTSKLHRRFQVPKSISIPQSQSIDQNFLQKLDQKSPKIKNLEFETEPRSAKSTKKLKKVRSKQGGRLSLKMRQVVSIREPQDDSDHESIVIQQSDDSLLGKLRPIHEDHQSNTDGHYKDSFLL